MTREQIKKTCADLNLHTMYVFQVSYKECRGILWGLKPPEQLHELWVQELISAPPYVNEWLKIRTTLH